MLLTALVDEYVESTMLRPKTIQNYSVAARQLSVHLGGDTDISRITERELLSFRSAISERASPQTFNSYRRHLSSLFRFAVRRKHLGQNPFDEVGCAPVMCRPQKTVKKSVITLSVERMDSEPDFNRMGPAWFWRIVVRTLYLTAMRRRQIVCLVWEDIDFLMETIRLRAEGSKTRREWQIPLSSKLAPDLARLKSETEARVLGPVNPASQVFRWPLFATRRDRLKHANMTEWQLDHFFKYLSVLMDTRISAHRIRHTTATKLANTTENLRLVQELLGHTDIRTTMGYVHPDLRQLQKMIETLD